MDIRERTNDPFEAAKLIVDGRQCRIWTAMPGIIQSYDATKQTVTVQLAIQGRNTDLSNNTKWVNLPILQDVPICFPCGGAGQNSTNKGVSITFPVQQGDECLVVFASRCFDAWWQNGGVQPPLEARMHDLSDGFAILGFRSQPRKLTNVDTSKFQIRSDDDQAIFEIDPQNQVIDWRDNGSKQFVKLDIKNGNANIQVNNTITFKAQKVDIQANTTIEGTVHATQNISTDQDVSTGSGVTLNTHTHTDPQGGVVGTAQG